MPDIRLIPSDVSGSLTFDWLQTPVGLLDETEQLASAVLVALNTDALADETEVLPDPRDSDRRGWWGDMDAERIWGGWPIGSKLWLLTRAKIVDRGAREGATVTRVERYVRDALKPLIDAGVCSKVAVSASQTSDKRITATVVIYRGPKPVVQLQYEPLWQEIFPGS
ncbi:phage GP46 family protein [Bradyrhizobium japonicum]|uniref:phage GP46 family protein n=1 Tax=Bradyrhizobium japonicum TaxID=375 RepID=UPI00041792BA|nr:phage GP46 family protein [Bradyrhizobium japonicum]